MNLVPGWDITIRTACWDGSSFHFSRPFLWKMSLNSCYLCGAAHENILVPPRGNQECTLVKCQEMGSWSQFSRCYLSFIAAWVSKLRYNHRGTLESCDSPASVSMKTTWQLIRTQVYGLQPQSFWLSVLRWGLKICISNYNPWCFWCCWSRDHILKTTALENHLKV